MADLPPAVPAAEFTLASTGMSKGLAQTDGPQAIARGELGFGPRYIAAYAKNGTSPAAEGEAAASIGVRTKAQGVTLGASAAWKRALDPHSGSDANALEINGFASRALGPVTPRVSLTWSPDDLGSTGRTIFAELGGAWRLRKSLSASGAVGRRERSGGLDYTAWNAGLAWTPAKPLTLDLRYHDTNRGTAHPYRARVVASARLKF